MMLVMSYGVICAVARVSGCSVSETLGVFGCSLVFLIGGIYLIKFDHFLTPFFIRVSLSINKDVIYAPDRPHS